MAQTKTSMFLKISELVTIRSSYTVRPCRTVPSRIFFIKGRSKIRIKKDDVVTHTSDPRRLVVIVTTAVCQFAVASLHAPDQTNDNVVKWWADTTDIFQSDLKEMPKTVFMDANITMPEVWALRDFVLDDTKNLPSNSSNSHVFKRWVDDVRLWMPAASSWKNGTAKSTFVARGSNTMDDYILLSNDIMCEPASYHVDESYDTANKSDDHLPVIAEVQVLPNFSKSFARRRVVSYDRKGYRDPAKVAYFNSLLSCAHSIPFEVDPTSHCFIVQEAIRRAAEQAFPKPQHTERNDVIGAEAFGLICQRGRLRK